MSGIGPVPDGLAPGLEDFLKQLRFAVFKSLASGGGGGGGTSRTTIVNVGGTGGSEPTPDLTPPPTPTGTAVVAGIDFVGITTDPPNFTEGHGYLVTNVYGAKWPLSQPSAPTFSNAVQVGSFVGQVGDFASDPATRWCVWLKWKTRDGVESSSPAGGANGFQVTTGQNVSSLLEALSGQITSSQLHAALSTRINLIDAPSSTPGSVDARIATESSARTSADAANASAISATASQVTTLQASVAGNTAAISQEASVRAAADGFYSAQYTLRVDVGNRVAGFGITGTQTAAGPTFDFGVLANRFYVAPPAGTTGVSNIVPFTVQTTPTVTASGEVLPAGVYIDAAFIRNLEASLGRFQNAIITNAMVVSLSASKIIAGSLAVGEYIQSSGFVPGGAGFRIDGGGGVEIRSVGGTRVLHLNASGTAPVLKVGSSLEILANGTITVGDGSGGTLFATGQSIDWARIGGATRPKAYRVVARGAGATGFPIEAGVYDLDAGTAVYGGVGGVARSYMLVEWVRATGAFLFAETYDVVGNGANTAGRNAATLASHLNALTSSHVFALFSFDEPAGNRLTGGLPDAIYRCGGTPAKFAADTFLARGAYVLVGIGGCGPGMAAFEGYAGSGTDTGGDGPDNAWIDVTFQLIKGNIVTGGGALAGFQITPGNATTYIANAAIPAAAIGSLNVGVLSTALNGGSTSGRLEAITNVLQVFDDSNVVRVKIGRIRG